MAGRVAASLTGERRSTSVEASSRNATVESHYKGHTFWSRLSLRDAAHLTDLNSFQELPSLERRNNILNDAFLNGDDNYLLLAK